MNKQEILEKLNGLNLDKEKIIIISGASLVVQGIIEQTGDIDMATSTEYFKTINWKTKVGALEKTCKTFDVFDISDNLYNENEIVIINGFKFSTLEYNLKIKKLLNRPKDYKIINIIENLKQV